MKEEKLTNNRPKDGMCMSMIIESSVYDWLDENSYDGLCRYDAKKDRFDCHCSLDDFMHCHGHDCKNCVPAYLVYDYNKEREEENVFCYLGYAEALAHGHEEVW